MNKVYQIVKRPGAIHFFKQDEIVVVEGTRIVQGLEFIDVRSIGGEKPGLYQSVERRDLVEYDPFKN